jgi:hypothetical protein
MHNAGNLNLKKKVWGIKNTHRKFHPATISYPFQLPIGHDHFSYP